MHFLHVNSLPTFSCRANTEQTASISEEGNKQETSASVKNSSNHRQPFFSLEFHNHPTKWLLILSMFMYTKAEAQRGRTPHTRSHSKKLLFELGFESRPCSWKVCGLSHCIFTEMEIRALFLDVKPKYCFVYLEIKKKFKSKFIYLGQKVLKLGVPGWRSR